MTTWRTTDERSNVVQEVLDAAGAGEFIITPKVPPADRIIVYHLALNIDQQTGSDPPTPQALIYLGKSKKENFVDGTSRGHINAATYPFGLIVPSGAYVTIVVSSGLADGDAIARIQYAYQERAT